MLRLSSSNSSSNLFKFKVLFNNKSVSSLKLVFSSLSFKSTSSISTKSSSSKFKYSSTKISKTSVFVFSIPKYGNSCLACE
ncbi:hypothetical protein F8M41_003883 [Gigaspora margarita]|uniref:Uncharacterized protein n=1 Tax=Gigaspora margarita TaxID=4874 RepID=A0A8H3XAK2_GIGMA|nr:hypothetical protein F8M41_003883 [Gigaspora margarita]